ncbi:MAG: right-handed parallel beta-helix repeat-containing protein, partial [Planctomycetes bacterium]|nr:right-handed parallel beta-helix repeat-containing protein [Planctomycetota bacterium]
TARWGGIFSAGDGTLASSTVSGNNTAGNYADGGGIFAFNSSVTLTHSTVSGNSTAGNYADGGGIRSGNAVTLTSSTVSGNSTTGTGAEGGGIWSYGAVVTLTSSTVSGNSTAGYSAFGGGIFSAAGLFIGGGDVTLINSTVSGNSTTRGNASGGGIFSEGAVTLTSSTVTDNHAYDSNAIGGGIRNFSGAITISHSIVAGNTTGSGVSPDVDPGSGMFSVNFSLIGTGVVPDAGTSGNNVVTNNPMLGALADNGGPTETHALLAGSLAIDMGDLAASPGVGNVPLFDQRGNNFGRVQNGRIDIGAFEVRDTLSADFDNDGFITGFDFLAWQRGFGTPAPLAAKTDGDADNDQDVDGDDLDVWELQYGTAAPLVAAVAAPLVAEPLFTSGELADVALAMSQRETGEGDPQAAAVDELPLAYIAEPHRPSGSATSAGSDSPSTTSSLHDDAEQLSEESSVWEDALDEVFASAFE